MKQPIGPMLMVALEDIKAGDIVWLDPKCGKIRRASQVKIKPPKKPRPDDFDIFHDYFLASLNYRVNDKTFLREMNSISAKAKRLRK